jgi:hypothetical protein
MFVKTGTHILKVYKRMDGSKYYVKEGKRINVRTNQKLYNIRPCRNTEEARSRTTKKCRVPKRTMKKY